MIRQYDGICQLGWLEYLEDFQTTGVPAALKRDATDGVQFVHVEVKHDEINTLFDPAIVYAKGSRLMHASPLVRR